MHGLGNGGLPWKLPAWGRPSPRRRCKRSDAVDGGGGGGKSPAPFPFKQAATAASLVLAGDTIAQVSSRVKALRAASDGSDVPSSKIVSSAVWSNHDWLRALRMASYGFLLYGPGSYAWYQLLDRSLPGQTFVNLSAKVVLNQIVLGPCVIAVVFAWNNLWQGQLSQLPKKYQKDALPTLFYGFRFWIPVSVLNFSVIPLQTRVAFMSTCSIFWNFYLSSTLSK
ncbi:unnamed protein product [Spirodela intermedia]|uniref:Uncharacterized protein n=1 Tax=Spirodela intermedia TaxID=51605 RepID=A0A7I8IT48_SPIIN|nr:unnamed protein product [Spirodela intermedia]CAA6661142.1 unnamed protein product [Spirodela intermedia]